MEKPIIQLTNLEGIAVEIPTQKSFNRFMKVCECGGWMLFTKKLPTESLSLWEKFKEKTLVTAQNPLFYGSKSGLTGKNYTSINENAFYEREYVDKEQIKNIEKYFRLNKK